MIIAAVLETTDESAVMWDMEFTKVNCRLVYGYKASLYRSRYLGKNCAQVSVRRAELYGWVTASG